MDKRYQVFVSSTFVDLVEERKEVTQAILECNCFPAGMELFPASNKKQWDIIRRVIDESDFYLLIIAGRYGSQGNDDDGNRVSYTEMEFNYAIKTKKPIIALLHRNPDELPLKASEKNVANSKRLEKFREKAKEGRMVSFWDNKHELRTAVITSLHHVIDENSAMGWIRADNSHLSTNVYGNGCTFYESLHSMGDDIRSYLSKHGHTMIDKEIIGYVLDMEITLPFLERNVKSFIQDTYTKIIVINPKSNYISTDRSSSSSYDKLALAYAIDRLNFIKNSLCKNNTIEIKQIDIPYPFHGFLIDGNLYMTWLYINHENEILTYEKAICVKYGINNFYDGIITSFKTWFNLYWEKGEYLFSSDDKVSNVT